MSKSGTSASSWRSSPSVTARRRSPACSRRSGGRRACVGRRPPVGAGDTSPFRGGDFFEIPGSGQAADRVYHEIGVYLDVIVPESIRGRGDFLGTEQLPDGSVFHMLFRWIPMTSLPSIPFHPVAVANLLVTDTGSAIVEHSDEVADARVVGRPPTGPGAGQRVKGPRSGRVEDFVTCGLGQFAAMFTKEPV